jgi:hypothetical protein
MPVEKTAAKLQQFFELYNMFLSFFLKIMFYNIKGIKFSEFT